MLLDAQTQDANAPISQSPGPQSRAQGTSDPRFSSDRVAQTDSAPEPESGKQNFAATPGKESGGTEKAKHCTDRADDGASDDAKCASDGSDSYTPDGGSEKNPPVTADGAQVALNSAAIAATGAAPCVATSPTSQTDASDAAPAVSPRFTAIAQCAAQNPDIELPNATTAQPDANTQGVQPDQPQQTAAQYAPGAQSKPTPPATTDIDVSEAGSVPTDPQPKSSPEIAADAPTTHASGQTPPAITPTEPRDPNRDPSTPNEYVNRSVVDPASPPVESVAGPTNPPPVKKIAPSALSTPSVPAAASTLLKNANTPPAADTPSPSGNAGAITANAGHTLPTQAGPVTRETDSSTGPEHIHRSADGIPADIGGAPANRFVALTNAALINGTAADVIQAGGASLPASQITASTPSTNLAAPPVATAMAVPLADLPVAIATQAKDGKSRFEIRLDPPELGRIDVRLDIDTNGNVVSRLVAERPETLDLLRRDAPQIERALQDAGLKTGDQGLQFSLRDQSDRNDTPASLRYAPTDDDTTPLVSLQNYARMAGLGSGIDIRV